MNLLELVAKLKLDSSEYEEGINTAADKAAKFGDGATKAGKKLMPLTVGLVGLGGASVKTAENFEASMSQVAATLGYSVNDINNNVNGASDTMDKLTAKAKEMGETTNFSASDAAEALNILAMSGYDAEQSMAMVEDVLHLAAAGSMDMASAASYVSGSMKGFNDATKDSQYYADLMARGATLANTSVQELGEAMQDGAATSAAYNQSADSMTLALLRLAEQGEKGSAAGTSLAAAMKNIYTPTDQAASALQELGVAAYDETGAARDFNTVVNELSDALSGMSDEEANAYKQTIFGIQGLNAFNKMTVTSVEKQEQWAVALANASVNLDEVANAMQSTGAVIGNTNVGFKDLADDMVYNFDRVGGDAEQFAKEMKDYLHFEYDMDYSDAEKAIDSFLGVMKNQTGEAAKQYDTMTSNFKGQMDILKSQLEAVAISFGNVLLPVVSKVVGAFQKFLDWLNKLSDGQKTTIVVILGVVAALGPLLIMIGKIATGVSAVMKVVSLIKGASIASWITGTAIPAVTGLIGAIVPILPILAGVAAAIAAVILVIKNWGAISEWLGDVWGGIKLMAEDVWNGICDIISFVTETISGFISSVWEGITGFLSGIWNGICDIASTVWNAIVSAISNALTAAWNFISSIWNTITSFLSGIWNGICSIASTVWGAITSTISGIIDGLGNWLSGTWETIKSVASEKWNALKTTVGGIVDNIKTALSEKWNNIKQKASETWDNIKTGISNKASALADAAKSMAEGVKNAIKGIWSKAKEWGSELGQNLASGIKSAYGWLKDAASGAANWVSKYIHFTRPDIGPLHDYEEWMPDFMKGLAGGIKDNEWLVKDAVSDMASDMDESISSINPTIGAGTMVSAGVAGGGDIIIPIYLPDGDLWQEIVVNAQNAYNYRSGGR
jgi:TP901 family phage tail tape measure protein